MSTRRLGLVLGTVMLCMFAFIIFTGCVGYVGPDGDGGGGVYVAPPEPGVVIFGGDYDRGDDEHAYYHRGYESRQEVYHGDRRGGDHHWR